MKLGKNMIIYAGADLLGRSIGLITSPISTRLLTPDQYGACPLLTAVWSMVALAQYGGMDSAYPFFRAQDKDNQDEKNIFITSTCVATLSLLIVWGIFTLFAITSPWLQNYALVSKLELVLFLLSLVPTCLTGWYLYLLRFMHQALPFARVSLLGRVAGIVLTLPLMTIVPQGDRLVVMFSVLLIVQLVALVWTLKEFKDLDIWLYQYKDFSVSLARKMMRYGTILIPGAMIYAMSAVADRLLVGWFATPGEVAILTLGISLSSIVLMLKKWFALVWDPHLVEWVANKDTKIYLPKLQAVAIALSSIFFPLSCLSDIWGDWFINIMYPTSYESTARLVPFITLVGSVSILSLVAVTTVMIANSPKYHLPIYSTALLINCLTGILLIPNLGALGAVLGTLAAEVFILIAWIGLGRIILNNLNINWHFPAILAIMTGVFISFYHPGIIWSSHEMIERFLLTTILIVASLACLWWYRPHQGWKQILS